MLPLEGGVLAAFPAADRPRTKFRPAVNRLTCAQADSPDN